MSENSARRRIETESLVIGYAMSRLDERYLRARGLQSWRNAFREAAAATGVRDASFKNLRDEFDPLHDNSRVGWHLRPLRPDRERIVIELRDASDDALVELVSRLLAGDHASTEEAIDSLAVKQSVASNVAERLLTGRRAEEYFIANSRTIIGVAACDLVDARNEARGYDFGVRNKPEWAIEVKGLKERHGEILFTDREWREAKFRAREYWAVVVGNLAADPIARAFQDPYTVFHPSCSYITSITAVWRTRLSIDA